MSKERIRVHESFRERDEFQGNRLCDARQRFTEGRAAIARREYSEASPAELMTRVRARVEKNA
jgi:GTP cyclohydrolase II